MSSLIKTFHNNKIYHDTFPEYDNKYIPINNEVRFTKVLTKYSTEFNNSQFYSRFKKREFNFLFLPIILFNSYKC